MHKEFMDFIQSKQQFQPSYSEIVNEEAMENVEIYDNNAIDEIIFILKPRDLQWKDDPWKIMTRYFDTALYIVPTYNAECIMRLYSHQWGLLNSNSITQ